MRRALPFLAQKTTDIFERNEMVSLELGERGESECIAFKSQYIV